MKLVHFTDPVCPSAYCAEPQRLQLQWHYGDQVELHTTLAVFAPTAQLLESRGRTPQKQVENLGALAARTGMPFGLAERPRMAASRPACLAVVATRVHDAARTEPILRALRVQIMGGGLADDDATIAAAATDVGLDPELLRTWMASPEAEAALARDMAATRAPRPAGQLLAHKLTKSEDGRPRYSTPTWELHTGDTVLVAPGVQPWATYDVLMANANPSLERRAAPTGVDELLEWAPHPLATAEVAALLDIDRDAARMQLESAGAAFSPLGSDGFWSAA